MTRNDQLIKNLEGDGSKGEFENIMASTAVREAAQVRKSRLEKGLKTPTLVEEGYRIVKKKRRV